MSTDLVKRVRGKNRQFAVGVGRKYIGTYTVASCPSISSYSKSNGDGAHQQQQQQQHSDNHCGSPLNLKVILWDPFISCTSQIFDSTSASSLSKHELLDKNGKIHATLLPEDVVCSTADNPVVKLDVLRTIMTSYHTAIDQPLEMRLKKMENEMNGFETIQLPHAIQKNLHDLMLDIGDRSGFKKGESIVGDIQIIDSDLTALEAKIGITTDLDLSRRAVTSSSAPATITGDVHILSEDLKKLEIRFYQRQVLYARGEWSDMSTYNVGDIVTSRRSSYVSRLDGNSTMAPVGDAMDTQWSILSQSGLLWQGIWLSTNSYLQNDVVSYSDCTWLASIDIDSTSASIPGVHASWVIIGNTNSNAQIAALTAMIKSLTASINKFSSDQSLHTTMVTTCVKNTTASLSCVVNDPTGSPVSHSTTDYVVVFSSSNVNASFSSDVIGNDNGVYTTSFTPKLEGSYDIAVSINGIRFGRIQTITVTSS
jgi:hypothetical protein